MTDPAATSDDAPPSISRWFSMAEMANAPRGWYWAAFPGAWEFYSPELGKTQGLFHGDTLWHELMSESYWGPWSPPPPPAPGPVAIPDAAPASSSPARSQPLRCAAVVSKRDTYRRTGRGKTGFELHYVDKRCASPACAGGTLCGQHRALAARGREVRMWPNA